MPQAVKNYLWAAKPPVKVVKTEAIVSGGFPQLMPAGVNPKKKKESAKHRELGVIHAHCRFIEKAAPQGDGQPDPNRFRVVLIQEGLGNTGTAYYYTKAALKSAVEVFEGKKSYADHPSLLEEEVRPERSVRDIVGHFEEVEYLEDEDTTARLEADFVVLPGPNYDWVRSLLSQAVIFSKKYPDKDLIGLSINASGDAEPMAAEEFLEKFDIVPSALAKVQKAVADGTEEINVTNLIDSAVSTDLVTEAGAKGKVLELLEAVRTMNKKIKEAKEKKKAAQAKIAEAEKAIKAAGKDAKKLKEAEEKKAAAESDAEEADKALKQAEGEEGAPPPKKDGEGDDDGDGDEDHDDSDQDKALITDQLKKHGLVKESEEADDDTMKAAKHLHAAYKAEGHSAEEAADMAAKHMKCAHAAKEAMEAEDAAAKEAADADIGNNTAKPAGGASSVSGPGSVKKESELNARIQKLEGENARLREATSKREREEGLDKMLKESGLPMSVTKKFRESNKDVKSLADIQKNFKIFMEGYRMSDSGSAGEGGTVDLTDCLGHEKQERTSDDEGDRQVNLDDCKDDE